MVKVPDPNKPKPTAKDINKFIRGANADANARTNNKPKKENLVAKSVRLPGAIIDTIQGEADDYGRDFSEEMRDILIAGLKAKGIPLTARVPKISAI